jgi:hypothetical protein
MLRELITHRSKAYPACGIFPKENLFKMDQLNTDEAFQTYLLEKPHQYCASACFNIETLDSI